MAEETQDTPWPPPVIHFKVWLGDEHLALFAEVSGLDSETDTSQYRHDDQRLQPKRPSPSRVGTVTLRRGILARESSFWAWYDQTQQNIIEHRVVVIELLNNTGISTMRWTINGARPTKVIAPDAKSSGAEIAIDTLELAFETLTVSAL